LRNAVDLFEEEIPRVADSRWQRDLKNVTRRLGSARDLDVQIDFLGRFLDDLREKSPAVRPGIEYLRQTLLQRRGAGQVHVARALDRLESSRALQRLSRWIERQLKLADDKPLDEDQLHTQVGLVVNERLAELLKHERCVEQPRAVKALHAMRIAAKHLRYTLEVYAPLYPDGLESRIRWARQLQDWLGEIHDCDVWEEELAAILDKLPAAPPERAADGPTAAHLSPGIEYLRKERRRRRAKVYAEFIAAWRQAETTEYWQKFCRSFEAGATLTAPGTVEDREGLLEETDSAASRKRCRKPSSSQHRTGDRRRTLEELADDERLGPVFELARACGYESGHTHHVTHLALRFFDELSSLHSLDGERRFWLTCAALLHDIGWIEGRAGHHKTSLRLILESPLLPWDERFRRIVGSIARYHRRAMPNARHEHFAALSGTDQVDVRMLSAILRIADALDYTHLSVVEDLNCHLNSKRLGIRCIVTRPADKECTRAMEKGELLAAVFNREVSVKWQLRRPTQTDR
jgi:CHAD domain-containing protein